MLVTQQPMLKRFWYPVMPVAELAVTIPNIPEATDPQWC